MVKRPILPQGTQGTTNTERGNNPALDRLSYFDDPDFSRAMGLAVKSKETLIPVGRPGRGIKVVNMDGDLRELLAVLKWKLYLASGHSEEAQERWVRHAPT